MGAIENAEVLSDELRKDDLLKNDVRNAVEKISPYIPILGFLSGGITTAKHVCDYKKIKNKSEAKLVEIPTKIKILLIHKQMSKYIFFNRKCAIHCLRVV